MSNSKVSKSVVTKSEYDAVRQNLDRVRRQNSALKDESKVLKDALRQSLVSFSPEMLAAFMGGQTNPDDGNEYWDLFPEQLIESSINWFKGWEQILEMPIASQKFYASLNWAAKRSTELAEKHGLIVEGIKPSYTFDRDRYVTLSQVEGQEAGQALAQKYGFEFQEPAAMFDVIEWQRLDEETVIAFLGDDRGQQDFWVAVAWCPKVLCLLFFGEDKAWTLY